MGKEDGVARAVNRVENISVIAEHAMHFRYLFLPRTLVKCMLKNKFLLKM